MKQILSITRKEINSYFGSPMALIFIGTFLAVTLFAFFWVDTFFARGIADVRPLFRWMPLLTIFLVAALTMRQWSEEQQTGTLEVLLTLPVSPVYLVLGKFLAVMTLILAALALTLPIPITVSLLGDLDWGPVIGGYLAAILLAGAYTAIGLFMSSRTDNQILALISTVLVGGLFYLIGARSVTEFLGGGVGEILWAVGTGSRFESIERGVIDLRDLVYYLSLTGLFLFLNVISLDSKRWSRGSRTLAYRRSYALTAVLLSFNLALANVWMYPLHGLRLDLTEQRMYTLSQTTRDLIGNLEEPLLIRGYISERTHPLLAPLAPAIRDMLREYEIASNGQITAEVVDPIQDPELEAEANQTYGIQPTPFQIAGRYEASVINSYFDILIRYGDQNVVLNFRDLIEVEALRDGTVDVRLRNLEYELTRSIKNVVYGFQSVDAVLAAMDEPVNLTLYVTPEALPEWLAEAPTIIETVAADIQARSGGQFTFDLINPDAPDSPVSRQTLFETHDLQPIPVSFFADQTYYLHMMLTIGDEVQLLYPSGELSEASVRTTIESALKRASAGFLKVVGLWHPPDTPTPDPFGQAQPPLSSWFSVAEQLRRDYNVRNVDLSAGHVPADVDVLVVISPKHLTDRERFAIDQYLMRGGAVVVAASSYSIASDPFTGGLGLQPVEEGLQEMLESYGVHMREELVMDPQNQPFPVPVTRQVGGFQVQEIQAINYPFFVDVRSDGMDRDSPILRNLSAVTMNWASAVELGPAQNAEREASVLLRSSSGSWLRTDINIQPDFDLYPDLGFPVQGEQQSYPLAAAIQGEFQSFFADRPSPFETDELDEEADEIPDAVRALGTIETSPASARLVVIGSAHFIDDIILELSARLTQDRILNNLQFMQNAVDWAVEDLDLLDIRGRGSYARVLKPMDQEEQTFWEVLNYVIALSTLVIIGAVWQVRRRSERPMELTRARDQIEDDQTADGENHGKE